MSSVSSFVGSFIFLSSFVVSSSFIALSFLVGSSIFCLSISRRAEYSDLCFCGRDCGKRPRLWSALLNMKRTEKRGDDAGLDRVEQKNKKSKKSSRSQSGMTSIYRQVITKSVVGDTGNWKDVHPRLGRWQLSI